MKCSVALASATAVALRQVALATALTVTIGGMALSPAKADTWNFNSPTGPLGTTQNYISTPGGFTATVAGFLSPLSNPNTAGAFSTPGNLFGKNDPPVNGSVETGVGMQSPAGDTTGQNEIQAGTSFVRLSLPFSLGVTMTVDSVTATEKYDIWGSTSATSGYTELVTGATAQGTPVALSALCPGCTFFALFADGLQGGGSSLNANVLLSAATAFIPLPGALPLFATGLGALGLLGLRRKKKTAALAS